MTEVKDIVSPDAAKAAAEAKAATEAKPKGEAEGATDLQPKPELPAGETVSNILSGKEQKSEKTVPESVFLEIKNENKAVWTELKKLQDMIATGVTKKEVSETLKKIGEKYKVDENFLAEVSSAIKAETDAETDKKISSQPKPVEDEKEKSTKSKNDSERIDRIFNEHFDKTIAAMPDFKDVADKDVIKSLTLDPANANKTFAQILEKAYGHLVKGKGKTIESTKPGGGKDATEIDYVKASKDTEYFKSIMADPALRKEYNGNLHKRLKL